jgi:hypothetical protein
MLIILEKFPNITRTINPFCTRHRMITYTYTGCQLSQFYTDKILHHNVLKIMF